MINNRTNNDLEGILIVNKPSGITSHDVVQKIRKKFGMKRVGHAGTLDPLATGVLVVLLGKSTKLFDQFVTFDKAYRATLILGLKTSSADIQGKVLAENSYHNISEHQIRESFQKFIGEIYQIPPMVSAIKHKGKKLYQLARAGIEVEREPRKVTISQLKLEKIILPHVTFDVDCSKGTYIRTLAEDIGNDLGCGACISQIERTKVGKFRLDEAVKIEDIDESHIRHWKN